MTIFGTLQVYHADDVSRWMIWWAEPTRSARFSSHVNLLGYRQSIINLDTKIANRSLNLGMAEQELNRP